MAGRGWVWVAAESVHKPSAAEKAAISATCETFITGVLMPRFLPEIRPTEFNYPVAIHGKWLGAKYRFMTRYRCDTPAAHKPEFDAPWARLDCVGRDRFDLFWHRHTGEWHRVFESVPLAKALRLIETEPYFFPC